MAENKITTPWGVTSNISQCPHRLQFQSLSIQDISLNIYKNKSRMRMLPHSSKHYTCSRTSSLGELSSFTNIGTAPWSITTLVFSEVPDAMFVRAQAASNYTNNNSNKQLINTTSFNYTPPDYLRIQNQKNNFQCSEKIQTWSWGKSSLTRNSTKRGTTPDWITSSIGGLCSTEQNINTF